MKVHLSQGHSEFPQNKKGEAYVQKDAARSMDMMLVRCGRFLLVASILVKKKTNCEIVIQVLRFQEGTPEWLIHELDVDG